MYKLTSEAKDAIYKFLTHFSILAVGQDKCHPVWSNFFDWIELQYSIHHVFTITILSEHSTTGDIRSFSLLEHDFDVVEENMKSISSELQRKRVRDW